MNGPRMGVVMCLLVALAGLLSGCGGGLAPVESPSEPPIPGAALEHLVGKGDTLYGIAWRYGLDYRALAHHNSIREPFTIFPGQRIRIPEFGEVITPPAESTVAAGRQDAPEEVPARPESPKKVTIRALGAQTGPQVATLSAPAATAAPAAPAAPAATAATAATAVPVPRTPPEKPSAPKPAELTPAAAPAKAASAAVSLRTRHVAGRKWNWPTQGKTVGTFKGARKGLDIAGKFEQPIRAAAPGRVVYAGGGLVGYGQLVIVKHDNRLLSAYAHNERLHVMEGETVSGGQHIADMGRSAQGRTLLHFEIRRDGKPVDPSRYLP